MTIYEFFTESYRRGYFTRFENGIAIFELGADDFLNFPALKFFRLVVVKFVGTGLAVALVN